MIRSLSGLLATLLFVSIPFAFAQTITTGDVTGTATDSSGEWSPARP